MRRYLLLPAAVLALCLAGWALAAWQQHRAAAALQHATRAHTARLDLDRQVAHLADSARFVRAGRALEAQRTLHLLRKSDDSLTTRLPAIAGLPAAPPRY